MHASVCVFDAGLDRAGGGLISVAVGGDDRGGREAMRAELLFRRHHAAVHGTHAFSRTSPFTHFGLFEGTPHPSPLWNPFKMSSLFVLKRFDGLSFPSDLRH